MLHLCRKLQHSKEVTSIGITGESFIIISESTAVIPPSHRRPGATAVLVWHKPQWHRHDRRGCGTVVPSLIAVAPRKTVKTADLRVVTAGTFNMFKTSAVSPGVGPICSGIAAARPSPPCLRCTTAVQSRKNRLATLRRSRGSSTAIHV